MDLVDLVNQKNARDLGDKFRQGDTIEVYYKIKEGEKELIQMFKGDVIAIRKGKTFTVRKVSFNTGIERIFPFCSPYIDRVKLVREGRVRRAKLYYLRDRVGKAARIKPKNK